MDEEGDRRAALFEAGCLLLSQLQELNLCVRDPRADAERTEPQVILMELEGPAQPPDDGKHRENDGEPDNDGEGDVPGGIVPSPHGEDEGRRDEQEKRQRCDRERQQNEPEGGVPDLLPAWLSNKRGRSALNRYSRWNASWSSELRERVTNSSGVGVVGSDAPLSDFEGPLVERFRLRATSLAREKHREIA